MQLIDSFVLAAPKSSLGSAAFSAGAKRLISVTVDRRVRIGILSPGVNSVPFQLITPRSMATTT